MYNEKKKINTMKYMKEKRDKLTLDMPKGTKERYRDHVSRHYPEKTSLTSVFMALMENDIKEKGGDKS